VSINKDLIGGVSIRVGDQVLDGSVRARLAQMKAALTA
jgi:F-type H+-transporting ATPase subunit delta